MTSALILLFAAHLVSNKFCIGCNYYLQTRADLDSAVAVSAFYRRSAVEGFVGTGPRYTTVGDWHPLRPPTPGPQLNRGATGQRFETPRPTIKKLVRETKCSTVISSWVFWIWGPPLYSHHYFKYEKTKMAPDDYYSRFESNEMKYKSYELFARVKSTVHVSS